MNQQTGGKLRATSFRMHLDWRAKGFFMNTHLGTSTLDRCSPLIAQSELPLAVWAFFPPLMLLVLIPMAFLEPQWFLQMLVKDDQNGIVEHLTVILLLPGIVAGAAACIHNQEVMQNRLLRFWVLLWTLACIYCVGEEISWGQWYFGWATPDFINTLNDQHETNLHNMSSWFDQKPRLLLEIWIFFVGLILPLWNMARNRLPANKQQWPYWVLPTIVCVPTAALFTLVRFADWATWDVVKQFGNSELREYYIAIFMSIYLLSIYYRSRGADRHTVNTI